MRNTSCKIKRDARRISGWSECPERIRSVLPPVDSFGGFYSQTWHLSEKKSATRSYLDVESFFTNVSIEGAVQAALRKLENESDLANRRNLTPTLIADHMNLVLRSTYFQYNGSIYEQQDGAAMTSSVSAVIASIYMEEYEEQAKANATCKPKIWKRYVDDTFTFTDWNHVNSFYNI